MKMMATYFSSAFAELVVFLLALTCQLFNASGSRAEPESPDCNIAERFKSPYVTGFVSTAVTSYGCSSRHVTRDGRQVHLIYLHEPRTTERVKSTPSVSLLIKPSANFDAQSFNGVIFVLFSESAIMWKLQTEWFKNVTVEVWVSSNSEVTSDRRLKVEVNRLPVTASSRNGMVTWAVRKWGAVSTLTSPIAMVNYITAVVGNDASSGEFCDTENLSNATGFSAYNVKRQNSAGCVSSSDIVNPRVVHVIELVSAPNGTADVAVNIYARSKVTSIKHLVLVLKTHQRVRWHISAHRLRCTLDIITDQFVNGSGINVEPFRVVAERLNLYAGHNLITWTSEKYGQPLSFTRFVTANQFDVVVDSADVTEERPKAKSIKEVISSSLTIQCSSDTTMVAVLKASIESTGLTRSNFTLLDNACRASENSTHILLTTKNSECGTVQLKSDSDADSIVYQNMIMVHGGMEEMPLSVNFCCVYPVKQADQLSRTPARAQLKLYRDNLFLEEFTETPAFMKNVNEVFVEIDAAINVMFGNCSVGSVTGMASQPKELINGCWSDKSVTWIHSKSHGISDIVNHGGIRFRLDLSMFRLVAAQNLVAIQCRLVVCSVQAAVRSLSSGHRQCDCKEQLANASVITMAISSPILIEPAIKSNETQRAYHQQTISEEQKYCNEVTVGISSGYVVGIAFAAFTIGVLLMTSLWCIHERTGKLVERKRKMLRSADTSGESTPSSTVARHVSAR